MLESSDAVSSCSGVMALMAFSWSLVRRKGREPIEGVTEGLYSAPTSGPNSDSSRLLADLALWLSPWGCRAFPDEPRLSVDWTRRRPSLQGSQESGPSSSSECKELWMLWFRWD